MEKNNHEYELKKVAIRLVEEPPLVSDEPIQGPEDVIRILNDVLRGMDREFLCVINLRGDGAPINFNVVSMGCLNQSIAHPREILKTAFLSNAANIILLHNHPSGNTTPSAEDVMITDRLQKVCLMAGIPLLDHVIVGNDEEYYSFREHVKLSFSEEHYVCDPQFINLENNHVAEDSDYMEEFLFIGKGR